MGVSPHPFRLSWLGKCSALALAPALALAEPAPHAEAPRETAAEAPQALPEVTVTAEQGGASAKGKKRQAYKQEESASVKNPTPLQDTPATINVVPGVIIKERGAYTLTEALRGVAGVSAAAGEGGIPNGDNLTLRGFNARNDLFTDGARDLGGYFRDTFNTESVEVSKGPASVQAGRGSTGGIINRVTKAPKLKDAYGGEIAWGTDETKRITADVNHVLTELPLEGAALRLNVMAHENAVAGRDNIEFSRLGVAPSLSLGLGTETRLTLSYLRQQDRNEPDNGMPYLNGAPLNVPRDTYFNFLNEDYERISVDQVTAVAEHDVNDAITVRNTTRHASIDRESLVTRPSTNAVNPALVDRGRRFLDTTETITSNQTDMNAKFATGFVEHTFVAGLEFAQQRLRQDRNTYAVQPDNIFAPDPFAPYTGVVTPGAFSKAHAETYAAYVQDTLKLNDQWQLTGGLRQDFYDSEYDADNGESFSREDRMLSKKAGLVYKPFDHTSLYLSYGTSFNPSAEGVNLTANNFALKPERSRSFEAGAKQEFLDGKASATAALFRTERTNVRTADGLGGVTTLDGEQHVDGLELSLTGELAEGWQLSAGYTFMKSNIDRSSARDALGNLTETGKEVLNVPDHTFSLWTTYNLPKGWQIGGGAFYVGERFANNTNTALLPDYWRFDTMLAYELTKNVQAKVNVYNITDEYYYDRVYLTHAVPGAGRSALFSLAFQF